MFYKKVALIGRLIFLLFWSVVV